MTWFQRLYETYENVLDNPLFADGEDTLTPIGHTSHRVNIIVRIEGKGHFRGAEFIGKQSVILPATEDSAGRTSGRVAHPLIDQIKYCAKDYPAYSEEKGYFGLYEKTLSGWVRSPHSHPMAEAVYAYISKGTLVSDLVREKLLYLNKEGRLATVAEEGQDIPVFKVLQKDNHGKRYQGKLMIAWQVEIPGENESRTWKNESLQESWIKYNASLMDKTGVCIVTGNMMPLASNHPKNIRKLGDRAKIISSNADTKGFYFYRGRFISSDEACSVGYETTQKAHNALRWLIARQGYKNGDQVILAWTPKGKPVPQPLNDLLSDDEEEMPDFSRDSTGDSDNSEKTVSQPAIDHTRDLGQTFAQKLKRRLQGFDANLDETDTVAILGLESATTGRLSAIFYMEQLWPEYRLALESWQNDMAWWIRRTREADAPQGKKRKTEVFWKETAPTPNEIALAAYGKRMDDQLKKNAVERLLPCIAGKRPVPFDLVTCCVSRACNRAGLENREWEMALWVACAMYKGYCARRPLEKQRRKYKMGLDETNTSRDYLYGRLLATAERIEGVALSQAEKGRPTNAERLMQRFADYPYAIWPQLYKAIQPYRQRLQQSRGGFLRNMDKLMDEIMNAFEPEEFMKPDRLSGEFLLGYHCQRQAFRNAKESETSEKTQGENE